MLWHHSNLLYLGMAFKKNFLTYLLTSIYLRSANSRLALESFCCQIILKYTYVICSVINVIQSPLLAYLYTNNPYLVCLSVGMSNCRNADRLDWHSRSECRPPKMAVFGRNADPSDTANYRLAAWLLVNTVGRCSGSSTFRPVSYTHLTLPTNREV